MKFNSKIWIVLLGVVIGLITYSFNVDNKILFGISAFRFYVISMSLGAFIASFIIQTILQWSVSKTALLISLGILLGIIVQIFYDVIFDKASHNLFPLEIIFSLIIVLPSTYLGVFSSKLIKINKK